MGPFSCISNTNSSSSFVVDLKCIISDLNTELPEELGSLLGGDILSTGTSSASSSAAQNGIGSAVDISQSQQQQQHQMVQQQMQSMQQHQQQQQQQQQHQSQLQSSQDASIQNHQQMTHLLSVSSAPFSSNALVLGTPRYTTVSNVSAPGAVPNNAPHVLNQSGNRMSLSGIITSLGAAPNSIVTITRPGNITLLPAGNPSGLGTVVGVHRTPLQQQQHINANAGGIVNAGGAVVQSVGASNGATMSAARLLPLSSSNAIGMVINVPQNHNNQQQPTSVLASNGAPPHMSQTLAAMQRNTPRLVNATALQAQHQQVGLDGSLGVLSNTSQLGIAASSIAPMNQINSRVCVLLCYIV